MADDLPEAADDKCGTETMRDAIQEAINRAYTEQQLHGTSLTLMLSPPVYIALSALRYQWTGDPQLGRRETHFAGVAIEEHDEWSWGWMLRNNLTGRFI